MQRRHFKPEQIIHMLREAEIKLADERSRVVYGARPCLCGIARIR